MAQFPRTEPQVIVLTQDISPGLAAYAAICPVLMVATYKKSVASVLKAFGPTPGLPWKAKSPSPVWQVQ